MVTPDRGSSDGEPTDSVQAMLDQWSVERPELDMAGMAVVLRVLVLANELRERLKEALRAFDLQPWEFDVLSALRRVGDPYALTPSELCESAQLTSGAMTNRIDRLAERGFVRREQEESDGRSVLVILTPKGRRLVDRALVARVEDASRSIDGLPTRDAKTLAALLAQVLEEMHATA